MNNNAKSVASSKDLKDSIKNFMGENTGPEVEPTPLNCETVIIPPNKVDRVDDMESEIIPQSPLPPIHINNNADKLSEMIETFKKGGK